MGAEPHLRVIPRAEELGCRERLGGLLKSYSRAVA